jgi:hypothetical protein
MVYIILFPVIDQKDQVGLVDNAGGRHFLFFRGVGSILRRGSNFLYFTFFIFLFLAVAWILIFRFFSLVLFCLRFLLSFLSVVLRSSIFSGWR